jgi:hypothetical protein
MSDWARLREIKEYTCHNLNPATAISSPKHNKFISYKHLKLVCRIEPLLRSDSVNSGHC